MRRRLILGVLAVLLLGFLYRVFAVYTVRSGDCRPRLVDPGLRLQTRDVPPQTRPLVVMTWNIAGHDELADYIFAEHGWQVRSSRTWPINTSDHLPVTAELVWDFPGVETTRRAK